MAEDRWGELLEIGGVPREYSPGQAYILTVTVAPPGQSRWGFELSSRFAGPVRVNAGSRDYSLGFNFYRKVGR